MKTAPDSCEHSTHPRAFETDLVAFILETVALDTPAKLKLNYRMLARMAGLAQITDHPNGVPLRKHKYAQIQVAAKAARMLHPVSHYRLVTHPFALGPGNRSNFRHRALHPNKAVWHPRRKRA